MKLTKLSLVLHVLLRVAAKLLAACNIEGALHACTSVPSTHVCVCRC